MNTIFANLELRLANNNINSNTLKDFLFKNIKELPVNLAPFLVFLMKISTYVRDCQAIWDKTTANLNPNNNHKSDNNINSSDNIDSDADLKESGE